MKSEEFLQREFNKCKGKTIKKICVIEKNNIPFSIEEIEFKFTDGSFFRFGLENAHIWWSSKLLKNKIRK